MKQQVTIIAHGNVHGVFYRHAVWEHAAKLGLSGTVKNMPDGTVAVVACGEQEKLEDLVGFCRNNPGVSMVDTLDIAWQEAGDDSFDGFQII